MTHYQSGNSHYRRICPYSNFLKDAKRQSAYPEKSLSWTRPAKEPRHKVQKKKKTKIPFLSPKREGGGDFLSSPLSKKDRMSRIYNRLVEKMKALHILQEKEQNLILTLSNYGKIGHKVWKLIATVRTSPSIKLPCRYIIKN